MFIIGYLFKPDNKIIQKCLNRNPSKEVFWNYTCGRIQENKKRFLPPLIYRRRIIPINPTDADFVHVNKNAIINFRKE